MANSSSSGLVSRQTFIISVSLSVLATSSLILGYQSLRRATRTEELKKTVGKEVEQLEAGDDADFGDMPDFGDGQEPVVGHTKTLASGGYVTPMEKDKKGKGRATEETERVWKKGEFDESLIREQLSRNYTFLGEESMAKVRSGYVVVVGCGGVGSWCALMLLRSGVSKLLLIDFDLTTLSSLNRHATATLADVGTPKVIATQKFLRKIAPWAEVDVKVGLWKKGPEAEGWLDGADWVVDAIDNLNTKVDLMAHCHHKGIKVFSSMGAGAKQDPTRIQIADISTTYEDPLAKRVRVKLRTLGVSHGIPVVYSTEVPGEVKLLPLPDEEFEKGKVHELGAFDDFRVRILPVLGPLPAIFGLNIATWILLDLAGKPIQNPLPVKNRPKMYDRLERALTAREHKIHGSADMLRIPITLEDISYIYEDLHQSRSTLPPFEALTKPCLIRWKKDEPVTITNVVVMSQKDADKHQAEVLMGDKTGLELWGEEAERVVQKRVREAKAVWEWRS